MEIKVRPYVEEDYNLVKDFYLDSENYGGQFDEARDTKEKLALLSNANENKLLVALIDEKIVGTVTLFEDGRAAWLYRFAVQKEYENEICKTLYGVGVEILKKLGHSQVLVYAPQGDKHFEGRYAELGMNKGSNYTCYWRDI